MKVVKYLKTFNKLLIIGPYPPPLGGVSVHIKRLNNIVQNSKVLDLTKYNKYIFLIKLLNYIFVKNIDCIHLHGMSIKLGIILVFLKRIKKFNLVYTDHNDRIWEQNIDLKKVGYILKNIDTMVLVGSQLMEDYKNRKLQLPNEIIIEPPFLPPPENEENKILETYPTSLIDFLDNHSHIITANAFQISFHQGIELYGLDMCIELISRLKKDYPTIGFVFALANESVNIEYLNKMKERIKELDIEDNFYFLTGQKELWPLFKKANLMIRPTSSDGYGISIAEALYFDCPAIASDVSDRPEGTILFKSRDLEDLYIKTKEVLNAKS